MIRLSATRGLLSIVIACASLIGECQWPLPFGPTSVAAATWSELRKDLLNRNADLNQFAARGPFSVTTRRDFTLRLSSREIIRGDLFLSSDGEKAPLVTLLHGFDSTKEDHAYQAMHLASWGMHSLCLQLPNKGPWINTGKTVSRIVRRIYSQPGVVDRRVDVSKLILIGHSFGGEAATVALAEATGTAGAILLDPATISRELPGYLSRIRRPVLILGADEARFSARNRENFFRYIRKGVSELSIKDALHEDAQFPSKSSDASEDSQMTFVKAMTAAAFSLSATGRFDYAWESFGENVKEKRFFNPKRK